MSWNYMNDALRTNVFVRFSPEAIACACIFLSARLLKIPLPTCPAWFMVFDVTEAEVAEIASNIVALYDRPAVRTYLQLKEKILYFLFSLFHSIDSIISILNFLYRSIMKNWRRKWTSSPRLIKNCVRKGNLQSSADKRTRNLPHQPIKLQNPDHPHPPLLASPK